VSLYQKGKTNLDFTEAITIQYYNNNKHFTAIIQVNLRSPALPVKNWRILLVQSFTAHVPLLTATSALALVRKRWSSPQ